MQCDENRKAIERRRIKLKSHFWPVIEDDTRKNVDSCFYCNALIGDEHDSTCVIIKQTVVFELTYSDGFWLEVVANVSCVLKTIKQINQHMQQRGGIQFLWTGLENHGIGSWGDSLVAVRFATLEDEDTLVNISEPKKVLQ